MIQNTLPKEVLIRSLIKGLWSDSSTKDLEIICGGLEPRPSQREDHCTQKLQLDSMNGRLHYWSRMLACCVFPY